MGLSNRIAGLLCALTSLSVLVTDAGAQPPLGGIDCDPGAATASVPAIGADGDWSIQIAIRGVPGARITRVEQDECPIGYIEDDTAPDARASRPAPRRATDALGLPALAVRLRKERFAAPRGDGRVYYLYWESDSCLGPTLPVEVHAPVAGTTAIGSVERFDSIRTDPRYERCHDPCRPRLPRGWTDHLPEVTCAIDLSDYSDLRVVRVEQSECVEREPSVSIVDAALVVAAQTNQPSRNRLYRLTHTCADDEHETERETYFEVRRRGVSLLDPSDVVSWFPASAPYSCPCVPTLPVRRTDHRDGGRFTVDLSAYGMIDLGPIEQSECVTQSTSTIAGRQVTVATTTNDPSRNRLYRIGYTCPGRESVEHLYFEVRRLGLATLAPSMVEQWFDTTEVDSCPRCDPELAEAFSEHVPSGWYGLDLSEYTDMVLTRIEQSECPASPTSEIRGRYVRLRTEANDRATNRLYRIVYSCGDGAERHRYLEIRNPGAPPLPPEAVGAWFDTAVAGDCAPPSAEPGAATVPALP